MMRLARSWCVRSAGAVAVLVLLVLPTLGAVPGLDQGPVVAMTYDVLWAAPGWAPGGVRVDALDGKIGASWINSKGGDFVTQAAVQDAAGVVTTYSVPWSGWTDGTFDEAGRYHFFSYASIEDPERAFVSTWDPETKLWTTQLLDVHPKFSWPAAFRVDGVAHVAFPSWTQSGAFDGKVWRHDAVSNDWEIVADIPFDAARPKVAVDSEGNVHMMDLTFPNGAFTPLYSVWNGQTWTPPVPPPFDTGWLEGLDLAIDPQTDLPVFAYADSARRPHVVFWDASTNAWTDEMATTQGIGMRPHVGVSPDGRIHLKTEYFTGSYAMPLGGANMYYMMRDTQGVWSTPQPLLPVTKQLWTDMSMDEHGEPVIGIPSGNLQTVTQQTDAVQGIVIARPVARYASAAAPLADGQMLASWLP